MQYSRRILRRPTCRGAIPTSLDQEIAPQLLRTVSADMQLVQLSACSPEDEPALGLCQSVVAKMTLRDWTGNSGCSRSFQEGLPKGLKALLL